MLIDFAKTSGDLDHAIIPRSCWQIKWSSVHHPVNTALYSFICFLVFLYPEVQIPSTPKSDQCQFPLQPHQKYYITQHEELTFHSLLKWKMIIQSTLSKRTLSKPDSKFGPLPAELHLYLCNWALSKADTSLNRTVALVPRVSALERVDCTTNSPNLAMGDCTFWLGGERVNPWISLKWSHFLNMSLVNDVIRLMRIFVFRVAVGWDNGNVNQQRQPLGGFDSRTSTGSHYFGIAINAHALKCWTRSHGREKMLFSVRVVPSDNIQFRNSDFRLACFSYLQRTVLPKGRSWGGRETTTEGEGEGAGRKGEGKKRVISSLPFLPVSQDDSTQIITAPLHLWVLLSVLQPPNALVYYPLV